MTCLGANVCFEIRVPISHIFAEITDADFQRSTFTEHVCGVNGEQLTQEEEEIAMEVAGTEPDIGESLRK